MADNTAEAHGNGHGHHDHSRRYIMIWGVLVVLLVISVIGPEIGGALNMYWITLVTAFGIAFVKAWLVIKEFMHLDVEKPIVHYFLITSLVFMGLFFAGVSPDVMKHEGQRWTNVAAEAEVQRGLAAGSGHGDHGDGHGDDHGAAHGGEHHGDHGKADDHGKDDGHHDEH